ncbi:Stf0 family sulfotransferase [Gymnodinialimonas sp. 57CJ19]|uniref:Stf0 family sulfotransferase n=1 Tax=Gymnodinialimonas sp. 57CJ19 TaxID=3138498 RepID=UPI00313452EA
MTKLPSRSYVICTTPRSGSTLLCKLLAATGVSGMPDSHFHTPSVERWLAVYGLDETQFASREAAVQAVFEAALARGMANTDIFGLRMQRGSFGFFMEQLSYLSPIPMSDVERIESVFLRKTCAVEQKYAKLTFAFEVQ